MQPVKYLKGVLHELKRVKWPTQKEATYLTALVILISLALAAYMGAFDYLFTNLFEAYII